MATTTAWYLEERAKKLAIVYLTRRNDLTVTEMPEGEIGLDLLVGTQQNGHYTGRIFGVQLQATLSYSLNGSSNGHVLSIPDVPFPLCLFLFAMQGDEGYYAWLVEPLSNSTQRLKINETPEFKQLTNTSLANIVERVNKWYDGVRSLS